MSDKLAAKLKNVNKLMQLGDLVAALSEVEYLKIDHSDVGDVWALDGEIAIRQRRTEDAIQAVERAVELDPHIVERHIQRARCYIVAGNTEEARKSALQALKSEVKRLDHLLILGGALVRCNEHAKALNVYLKAKELSKDNVNVHRGLASVYRFLGDLEKAEMACNEAIQLDLHDYEMIGLRSSLRKQTKESNHVNEIVKLERSGLKNWRGAVHVAYALSKEYEDLEEYELSFTWLKHGASIKRKNLKYDLQDDIKIFDTLKTAFSSDRIAGFGEAGDPSSDPIFVLGMPRTGSTLVERIISSHSMVQNVGELSSFSFAMMNQIETQGSGQIGSRLALAENSTQLRMKELAQEYLKSVEPLRNDSPRFVDKLPLNSLNIGLIYAALPNAKIVHVERNHMDTCYAIYKFLFKNGYPFSYDLEELAVYYVEYYRLMQHWRDVLPKGHIYDIQYEEVVEDLSAQARELIKFLDLPWEDACEEFHTNRQASTTGSASQVRRPIYKSSVGKWRFFEKELQPLRATLEDAGVPIN